MVAPGARRKGAGVWSGPSGPRTKSAYTPRSHARHWSGALETTARRS